MFRRILVPVDGSPRGASAVEAARHLARRTGASMVLLHVQEPMTYLEDVVKVNQELDLQVRELRTEGIDARHVVEFGSPEAGIAETASSQHADLIIMAPHRRSTLDALIHPSVTAHMFAESSTPLLIWPERGSCRDCTKFLNIPGALVIVPLDGSELAEQALPFATACAREYRCPVLLVRDIAPYTLMGAGLETSSLETEYLAGEVHTAQTYLAGVRKRLDVESRISAQSMVLVGQPEHELLRLAETHDGSLMVMSTHGRSGITRMLLGSVTTRVMRDAPLPLLVVPPHAPAETIARWSEIKVARQNAPAEAE